MPASDLQSIYDFETAIETAIKTVLVAEGLTVYAGADSATLRKERPRCEILFSAGQALGHVYQYAGYRRDDQFGGQFGVSCITAAGEGEAGHRLYRAVVRAALGIIPEQFKADSSYLPYHEIMRMDHSGTTPVHSPEEGLQVSTLVYTIDFAVRTSAWPT